MNRYHTLDYLRGLAALGIMLFHYLSWTFGEFSAQTFMGRVGIYGVSIFYILSGLTLYLVYDKTLGNKELTVGVFFKRRLLRIFPLFWLSTIASIIILHGGDCKPETIVLNLTGLFGFVAWDKGIAVGSWSIGNELVFYCLFPLFIYFRYRNKILFYLSISVIFAIYLYFAYVLIDSTSFGSEIQLNHFYKNPLNQAFLFLSGYLIGVWMENKSVKSWQSLLFIFGGLLLFIFWPASGDSMVLKEGNARMVLTLCCILICLGFYKFNLEIPHLVSKPLSTLGEISYSLYMLHPLVHRALYYPAEYIRNNYFPVSEAFRFGFAIILSLGISYLVYNSFEKYFIRLGKKNSLLS